MFMVGYSELDTRFWGLSIRSQLLMSICFDFALAVQDICSQPEKS